MIRPKLSLRRPLAVLGAALLGLIGTVAVAAPASAHHTTIKATVDCDQLSGERVITWSVENSERNKAVTLQRVTAEPNTPVNLKTDETKPLQGAVIGNAGTIEAVQRVPSDTKTAKLAVHGLWEANGQEADNDGSINLPVDQPCNPAPKCVDASKANYSHTFDGPKGTATVKLDGDLPLCEDSKQWFTLVSYFAPRPQFATPQYVYGTPDSDWIGGTQTEIELNVEIPNCHTQVDLLWGGVDEVIDPLVEDGERYGNIKLGSPGAPGNRSKGPQGWYNGGDKSCTTPATTFASNCDGTVTVSLTNDGKTSKYPVEFEVKGENGWSKKVTVESGKADNGTVVPAENAGKIEVLVDGKVIENGTYSWERPEDCPLPAITTKADCENFALTATNPEGGLPVKVEFSYGDKTETRTVAPGKSETVTFKAGKDEKATVALPELDLQLEAVYAPEGDCGGGGGGGEEPGLPVTGAATSAIIAGAAVLLAAGVVLFLVARRRKLRFTA
ncbi:LPXTG cell wall anchor domain-containing protein [Micromonospora sp. WP24]|uniref:LPXTG cell wall anchor domain-containing protein n=1 Tax=Micromonospora sp. WP24 TaxID=2604469 RepID=UPI0011D872A3|nr:LPXTG cell wall anchor domain-containing protein [Micromonospora sp. WP24]TYC04752.1 LPXTG cell wall anchor domain-containing protein [Micromonospora sp. WP24]